MKQPAMNLGQGHAAGSRAVDRKDEVIPSRRRRIAKVRVNGRSAHDIGSAYIGRAKSETDRVGRAASEHAGAVECIGTNAGESSRTRKCVHRQEIGVLVWASASVPQCKLG